MSEHLTEQAAPVAATQETVATGHDAVDAVVASLAGLDGRPVGDHVAVFEAAHDRLRAALAHAGDDSPAS